MSAAHDSEMEQRIRERAFQIWIDEGQPRDRDKQHWELAKLAIDEEEGLAGTLVAPQAPQLESIETVTKQAQLPTRRAHHRYQPQQRQAQRQGWPWFVVDVIIFAAFALALAYSNRQRHGQRPNRKTSRR